jgi:radical SAM protein with 4Fe4S-binding SPASM domain
MDSPSFVQFYPTLRCNQGCSFCFNRNIPDATLYKDMSEKNAYALAELLKKAGVQEIDILGGEPMLIPWIKDFVSYVTDLNITMNISTNGSLPEIVNEILELKTALMNIGFSIHGFSETHNASTIADNFSKAITGIKKAIEIGKNPIVKSTLTQRNKKEIYSLIMYLKDLGIKRYYLLHEDIIGRQESTGFSFPAFWRFYSHLKKDLTGILDIGFVAASGFYKYGIQAHGRCDAGITKIAIMPDGSAFPCNLFFGFPEFNLGNIFSDGLQTIWNNPVLNQFREYAGNLCIFTDCKNHSTCSGGCPAHSYFFYHNLNVTDPRCTTGNV